MYDNGMTKNKKEKIQYKAFSFRMNESTWKKLKQNKQRSGLSWNLFLEELLKR